MKSISNGLSGIKCLPTNYKPQKKPSFITVKMYKYNKANYYKFLFSDKDILSNDDLKETLMKHRKQEKLSRYDTEKFRNSLKKQLCITMLMKGYHKSFSEILDLIQLQIHIRHELTSEHPVWEKPLIMQEPSKFEFLCVKLNKAEEADREGDLKAVYNSYYETAHYFQKHEERWISDYFFNKCLKIIGGRKSNWELRKEAESHRNLGLSYEKQTDDFTAKSEKIKDLYFRAKQHFENFYKLSKNQDWEEEVNNAEISEINFNNYEFKNSSAQKKLFIQACTHLQRVYTIISEKYCINKEEKIEYLVKSLDICRESGLKILEGKTSYMLGLSYLEIDQFETALICLNNFYEISIKVNNNQDYAKSTETLAICYKKLGNLEKGIEYLKKYIDNQNQEDATNYGRICSILANIYNSLGKYELATEYSKKAFDLSTHAKEKDANRVILAISIAHKKRLSQMALIEANTTQHLKNLILSKSETVVSKK